MNIPISAHFAFCNIIVIIIYCKTHHTKKAKDGAIDKRKKEEVHTEHENKHLKKHNKKILTTGPILMTRDGSTLANRNYKHKNKI